MKLIDALRVDSKSRIAFVGAGGKTTAMFSLARQIAPPVICLNTAHLALDQSRMADVHFVVNSAAEVDACFRKLPQAVVLFSGSEGENQRLNGVTDEVGERILHLANRRKLPILVEADGARMLPLKAPAPHEPAIPAWVNQVVVVVGLSAVGKPLTRDHVFRPEIYSELAGISLDAPIEIPHLTRVLLHPQGGMKNIPFGVERAVLINQRDTSMLTDAELFQQLTKLTPSFNRVLVGSVRNQSDSQIQWRHEGIGGVILAAGGSKRMGEPKQLLEWRGKPLVRHVAESAIAAGLDPVIVVTGSTHEQISAALSGLTVEIIHNLSWRSGIASSVRAALLGLGHSSGAAVFLLADMPEVPVELIQAEMNIFRKEPVKIIVPRINGDRSNPALFDRATFPDLSRLKGDTGGRALFDDYPIRWLDWSSNHMISDIDTPDDYARLVNGGSLSG